MVDFNLLNPDSHQNTDLGL